MRGHEETIIRLVHKDDFATIDPMGAELRSWDAGGTQLIWRPDPAIWADTAPLLFPVVGWTRNGHISISGEHYPLGLHGFIRHVRFVVAKQSSSHVRLVAAATDESRRLYPFDFEFVATYRLDEAGLHVELGVTNKGMVPMPYACGLHPGFRWPFAGGNHDDYSVIFSAPEQSAVPVISHDGLFTKTTRPVPVEGTILPLSPELFAREALCFLDACSRSLRFQKCGGPAITVTLENFPHIALWSKPEGGFLCIESWTGRGDDADSDGDFLKKPSMIHLPPGACARHAALYTLEPAQSARDLP